MEERDFFTHALRNDLECFFNQVYNSLHPGKPLLDNWHIGLICEYLMACYHGEIRRLNINIPPRFAKSLFGSVAFPMWVLGKDPTKKFICCSYSASLSNELNDKCRTIANNSWYQYTFPEFSIQASIEGHKTKDTQKEFITTKGGGRYATSTGATVTGKGADYVIIDDLINPQEGASSTKRKGSITWSNESLFSRLDDQKTGVIINIAQRLHELDFSAQCIDHGWETLEIPIYFERPKAYSFGNFSKIVKEGDYLHEDRIGKEEVDLLRTSLGTTAFSAQYLQNPAPADGGVIKKEWFRYYTELPEIHSITQSWDTAFKEGQTNDYSVCTTWGIRDTQFGEQYYLIDLYKGKLIYPDLKNKFIELQDKYNPIEILIEDKASGQSILQDLIKVGNNRVRAIKVDRDKELRANAITSLIENGSVFIPQDANWLDAFLNEIIVFPNGAHDDQVDSMVQYLNHINRPRIVDVGFSF
jgi:predicted phage terminase large subunit-like protein